MAKFKVGDIVIGNALAERYGVTKKGVKGQVICKCDNDEEIKIEIVDGIDKGGQFCASSECFDLVSDDEITITRHGNKVVAKYGKKVGVAKCSPEDEFDFAIGAKLAFNRLMGFVEPTLESTNDKIKVGDKVRIIGNKFLMHYIPIGSLVNVREVNECGNLFCMRNDMFGTAVGQWVNPKDVEKVSFDWDGFKAEKFDVKCTKDNYESFIAEAKKHDLKFVTDGFNPFSKDSQTVHATFCILSELNGRTPLDDNEILVRVEGGVLKADVAYKPDKDVIKPW